MEQLLLSCTCPIIIIHSFNYSWFIYIYAGIITSIVLCQHVSFMIYHVCHVMHHMQVKYHVSSISSSVITGIIPYQNISCVYIINHACVTVSVSNGLHIVNYISLIPCILNFLCIICCHYVLDASLRYQL